jgi:hypothetical protein
MAKGQKRSNKEIKKPKQQKAAAASPATFEKGLSSPIGSSGSKGGGKGRTNG